LGAFGFGFLQYRIHDRPTMARVEETKLRVLRGAVQDNFDVLHGIKTSPRTEQIARRQRLWLWGLLIAVAVAYLGMPSSVISTGKATAPQNPQPTATTAREAVGAGALDPALSQPQPLNRDVFPLALKRLVIDPGHGGVQTGAISENGLAEKEVTLDVALRLRQLLSDAPFEVLLTRDSDKTLGLEKRVAFANSNNADLFVSIHVNWMEPRTIRGPETFFVGPSDDPHTMKLVSMENRESGYSFADLRQALDKIYIDTRRNESRTLAKTIQGRLYGSLKQSNPELENRGVKTAPFAVLMGTQMPAILVEVSCLSNSDEVKLLATGEYREKIALALLDGIRSYAANINGLNRKG
jgi:N-acetylmuramoyl-L-alanine amidase